MEKWASQQVTDFLKTTFPNNKRELQKFFTLSGRVFAPLCEDMCLKYAPTLGRKVFKAKEEFKKTLLDGEASDKKRRGRPRKYNTDSAETITTKTRSVSKKRKTGGKKIWQFLIDVIHDKSTNNDLIEFNRETLIFKFKNTKAIAELWGERRGDTNMNFEKFSRAMRYHYKKGYLESDEKRLTYKFGRENTEVRLYLEKVEKQYC